MKKTLTKLMAGPAPALALVGGTALARNLLFPLFADDFAYSFIWDAARGGNFRVAPGCAMRRVKNLRDVIASQRSHYRVTGGRSVAHTLDQLFLIHGKRLFNTANTGVTLAQLLLADRLGAAPGEKTDSRMLLWLAGCFWFGAPHLNASCQWMTGACNYLWMGALQSAFILPYSRRCDAPGHSVSPALMGALGLLAGWSNEAGAGAALLYGGLAALRALRRRESVPGWMLTGLAGCAAGLAALLLAPGNYRRLALGDEFSAGLTAEDTDRTKQSAYFTPAMLRHHFKNGFLHAVLPQLPMHLPVLLYFTPLGERSPERSAKILALECASLAVPSALLLSPEFPTRAAYPSVIYGLGASAAALRALPRLRLPWLEAGLLGALALSVAAALGVDASLFRQARQRVRALGAHGAGDCVTLSKYRVPRLLSALAGDRALDAYALQFDIDEDCTDCYNHLIAQYYGVGTIEAQTEKGKDTE